jgi:hypothetical protein
MEAIKEAFRQMAGTASTGASVYTRLGALNEVTKQDDAEGRFASHLLHCFFDWKSDRDYLARQMKSDAERLLSNVESIAAGHSTGYATGFLADTARTKEYAVKVEMLERQISSLAFIAQVASDDLKAVFALVGQADG